MKSNKAYYRHTFLLPADRNGQKTLLNFGAIDFESTYLEK